MKSISLSQGRIALVDDTDYDYLSQFKWCANFYSNRWYAVRNVGCHRELMHRVIMGVPRGDPRWVDHRRREDTLDNRRLNLRIATPVQNAGNTNKHKDGTSGYKGVSRQDGKWHAQIQRNGQKIHLGDFLTPERAAMAYDTAALKHHNEFACTNASLGLLSEEAL